VFADARILAFMKTDAYRSNLAGAWYPADPAAVRAAMAEWMAAAPAPADDAPVCGLIVPHAGYAYSGAIAAQAYRRVGDRRPSRIVVMGPAHRVAIRLRIATPEAPVYRTVLGEVEIDTDLARRLRAYPVFTGDAGALPGEHSVEIQLPFLQTLWPGVPVTTLVCGALDDHAVHEAAAALRAELDPDALLVISTDFTHYGPDFNFAPFDAAEATERVRALDFSAFEAVQARDPRALRRLIEETGATICGRDPLAVLAALLIPEQTVTPCAYDTSGRMTGDPGQSVSYLAAVVHGRWMPARDPVLAPRAGEADDGDAVAEEEGRLQFDAAARADLLRLARAVIAARLEGRSAPRLAELGIRNTPALRQVAGAFVTLHSHGELRGCIGEIEPTRAVVEAVRDQALNAAFRDPRFEPLRPDELDEIEIEISALSVPHDIPSWEEFEPGVHGIILGLGRRSAVFLPQVATEQNWDRETTLSHLAVKAGCEADAWRDPDARFAVFEAVVFHESVGPR
jgi:MEMO1 family protein